jgi:hypothetical protein
MIGMQMSMAHLSGHPLAVQLAYPRLGDVAREVPQGCILLAEHVEPRRLERHVMRRHYVLVRRQVEPVVELSVEVLEIIFGTSFLVSASQFYPCSFRRMIVGGFYFDSVMVTFLLKWVGPTFPANY